MEFWQCASFNEQHHQATYFNLHDKGNLSLYMYAILVTCSLFIYFYFFIKTQYNAWIPIAKASIKEP